MIVPFRLVVAASITILIPVSAIRAAGSAKPREDANTRASKEVNRHLPDPVAVVEGQAITRAELEEAWEAARAQAGRKSGDAKDAERWEGYRAILEDVIVDKLLLKRSSSLPIANAEIDENFAKLKAQFDSEARMLAQIEQAGQTLEKVKEDVRASLRQQHWIEKQIGEKFEVAKADAQEFYDKNPDSFAMPETVRASHILVAVPESADAADTAAKLEKAKALHARVNGGEAFYKVAAEASEDPGSKDAGGDLNYFARDRMEPAFAEAAFKLKNGEISEPVRTKFGFHVIKVTDRKEAHTIPFPQAKEKIVAFLQDQKRRNAVADLIKGMRANADVKVNLPQPTGRAQAVD